MLRLLVVWCLQGDWPQTCSHCDASLSYSLHLWPQLLTWDYATCRFYQKAAGCIPVFRAACVEHAKGQIFNRFLEQMAAKYEHDKLRADFWARMTDSRISLISDDEVADTGISKQTADDWLKQHTPGPKV